MMLVELRATTRGDELFTSLMSRPIGSDKRHAGLDGTCRREHQKSQHKKRKENQIKLFTPIKHVSHTAGRRGGGEVAARWQDRHWRSENRVQHVHRLVVNSGFIQ